MAKDVRKKLIAAFIEHRLAAGVEELKTACGLESMEISRPDDNNIQLRVKSTMGGGRGPVFYYQIKVTAPI